MTRRPKAQTESGNDISIVLDSMTEMFSYYDLDLRVRWANRASAEALGISVEEMTGRHCYELWQHRKRPCPDCPVLRAKKSKQPHEAVKPTPDGRVWRLRAYPVFGPKGELIGLTEFGLDVTEQEKAMEKLRANEAKYRTIFENAPVGIFHSTLAGKYVDVNPEVARMLGYGSPGALIAEVNKSSIADALYVDKDLRPRLLKRTAGGWTRTENRYYRKDGGIIDADLVFRKITRPDGSGAELEGFVEDVTEKKKALADLKKSEEWSRRIVETAVEGIWAMDAGRLTTYVNERMAEMLGHRPGDMIGKPVEHFMYPEDLTEHRRQMKGRRRGEASRYERRFRRKDGTELWTIVSATALRDGAGKFAGSFAMFTDITERKRAERALRESEEQYRALVENSPDIVMRFDRRCRHLYVSPSVREVVGIEAEKFIGKTHHELGFPPEMCAFWEKNIRKVFRGGDVINELFSFEGSRGEVVFGWRLVPERGADGTVVSVLSISRDITERKTAEEEVNRQNRLLNAIHRIERLYFDKEAEKSPYETMLDLLVELSESRYGFLDEVLVDGRGEKYKKSLALSNISWDAKSRKLYKRLVNRELEFHDLGNLAGLPALSGETIVSNRRKNDPRARGLPPGHPPVDTYLGMPLFYKGELVGVAGVAERPGGYDETMAPYLEPFLTACAAVIYTARQEREREDYLKALAESEERYRGLVEHVPLSILVVREGRYVYGNPGAKKLLGLERETDIVNVPVMDTIHPDYHGRIRERLGNINKGKNNHPMEMVLLRADGVEVVTETLSVPISYHGKPAAMVIGHDVTERARSRRELQKLAEDLSMAQRIANVGNWEWDYLKDTRAWSPQMYRIFGYNPGEWDITLEKFQERILPDDREGFMAVLTAALGGTGPYENRFRIVRPDGEVRHVHSRGQVVFNDAGSPVRVFGTLQDVTEQVTAGEALRKNEFLLSQAGKMAHLGAWEMDIPGRVIVLSEELGNIFGVREESLGFEELKSVVHPDDLPAVMAAMKAAHAGAADYDLEHRVINRQTGELRYVKSYGELMRDDSGRPVRMYGATLDVTEMKEAERALRTSEETLRALVDANPESLFMMRPDGTVLAANKTVARRLGRSVEEMMGRNIFELVTPEMAEKRIKATEEAVRSGQTIFYADTRGSYELEHYVVPLKNPSGEVDRIAVFSFDVTERNRDQRLIAESLKEKEALLKEIHHRVKNNLQVVVSMLNLQRRREKEPSIIQALMESQQRVRAMALIHDRLYRSENMAEIDMRSYVRSLVNDLCQNYSGMTGNVRARVDAEELSLPIESAIPCGLIVNELVSNVFKYAFADGGVREPELVVELKRRGADRVLVRVRDNGRGLPDTVEIGSMEAGGLGLYLVSLFVKQLGGIVEARRENGAVFEIEFPVTEGRPNGSTDRTAG